MITFIIKCGMKYLIHAKPSMVASLKFGNGQIISSYTLLGMYFLFMLGLELIHVSASVVHICKQCHHWFRLVACSSPNHYLDHKWLIFSWTLWNGNQWNFNQIATIFIYWKCCLQMTPILSKVSDVNSLWPSDAIWWQRPGSTLAQVMIPQPPFTKISLKITYLKLNLNLPWVKAALQASRHLHSLQ